MPTLKLTNGAAHLLRNVLNVPDALSTLKEKFAAGVLLCGSLETLSEQPKEEAEAAKWLKEPWQTIELSNAQHEACKTAVNKVIDKLPSGFVTNSLISALGMEPD